MNDSERTSRACFMNISTDARCNTQENERMISYWSEERGERNKRTAKTQTGHILVLFLSPSGINIANRHDNTAHANKHDYTNNGDDKKSGRGRETFVVLCLERT